MQQAIKWYLPNNKKYKLSNFDMNPNHMFKQPKKVAEKQFKDPKMTIFLAFIARHGSDLYTGFRRR